MARHEDGFRRLLRGARRHPRAPRRASGIEAVLRDDSGNWFSLVQRPR
jgi:hypothetical protein